MRGTLLALTVSLIFGSVAPCAADTPRDEIEAALVTFAKAFNNRDCAAVAAHYVEDAAVFPPSALRVDGRAKIQEFWQGAIKAGLKDLTLKAVEVHGTGDMAYEVGELSYSARDSSGQRKTATGKYMVVWKKGQDGTWRLYRDIWNGNPAK